GVGPMAIWMPLELLPDEIKAQVVGDTHRAAISDQRMDLRKQFTPGGSLNPAPQGDEDAVDRTGDKEHDLNPKEAHGCGAKCEKCGEIHGGDHQCKEAADDTGRMPHNPSAGGARTGPDGPIVVDTKVAAPPTPAPAPAQTAPTYTRPPKGVGPAVVQYGTPTKTVTEDPEV